jgi:hypothetical protein
MDEQQRCAVDRATEEPPIGAAPTVLMFEAGQKGAHRGYRPERPVSAAGSAHQNSRKGTDKRGDNSSQKDL